ncbi:MAG: PpiC-type peptidyl-prolyl cis-trans isomerase [Panacagrimonas sp.]|jgi:hypothetical protein|nr:peptidylprolyl isomerase [Panacagrimonas sp.]MCC2656220.1 PpiC-type peptidyl-prolyl cis-trans isomerase [Panacagrimonas sp.]
MKLAAGVLVLVLGGASFSAPEPPNKDERDQVTRYHAYHVLVVSQDAAKAVRARIVAASNGQKKRTLDAFQSTARELSGDTGSASRGGDLGRVLEGAFGERFERAVLALEPGTLSSPFETEFGWHVAYLAEKRVIPVSIVCGPAQPLETADVARITVELGTSWLGPAADRAGTVSFLRGEKSPRGDAFREVTLHTELPHAVLVPERDPPACYRSTRTRYVADCARERLAGIGIEYFDNRGAKGAVIDAVDVGATVGDADFDAVPARGGARQVYDAVCQSESDRW